MMFVLEYCWSPWSASLHQSFAFHVLLGGLEREKMASSTNFSLACVHVPSALTAYLLSNLCQRKAQRLIKKIRWLLIANIK